MDAWLAAGLGAWVGGIGGFMTAAVLGAGHRDRTDDVIERPSPDPQATP